MGFTYKRKHGSTQWCVKLDCGIRQMAGLTLTRPRIPDYQKCKQSNCSIYFKVCGLKCINFQYIYLLNRSEFHAECEF